MRYPELKLGKTIIVYDEESNNIIKRTYEVEEGIKNGYEVIYTKNIVKVINLWEKGVKIKTVFKNKTKNELNLKKFILPEFKIEEDKFCISNQYKNCSYCQKNQIKKLVYLSSKYTISEGIKDIIFLVSAKEGQFVGPLWEREIYIERNISISRLAKLRRRN